MTDTTPRAGAPLLAASQAQKSVTHNEALYQFDALLCARFLDRDLTAPPPSPTDGDSYLVKAAATGAWTGQDGKIAYCADGAWRFYAPFAGLVAYVADECALVIFNGTAWVDYATLIALANIPMIGINTAPDSTNKLATKSAAILFDNIGNGTQVKLNKNAATDTASVLYQTSYSGRAEIGLTGDDNFHIKVSPDGSAWSSAMVLNKSTGAVGIGMTPVNVLDVTQNTNAAAKALILNANSGAGANAQYQLSNGSSIGSLAQWGTGFTSSGVLRQNGTYLAGGGAGGLTINTEAAQPIYFGVNSVERARFDASGNFVIGQPSTLGNSTNTKPGFSWAQSGGFGWIAVTDGGGVYLQRCDGTDGGVLSFFKNSGQVGGITITSSATSFNTSSGLTLPDGTKNKTNVAAMDPAMALSVLKAIGAWSYDFAQTGARGHGFVVDTAHENLSKLGHDLTQMGLYVRMDGDTAAGFDYGKVTPFLTAAVLDLHAMREAHEQKIARLEARLAELESKALGTAGA